MFSLAGGWLFDNLGPKSPFYLIGILDFIYAVFVIIASRFGLFNVYKQVELRSNLKRMSIYANSQAGARAAAEFKSEDAKSL